MNCVDSGAGIAVKDFAFCAWLRDEKRLAPQTIQRQNNLESLRAEYNKLWVNIGGNFAKEYHDGKTYQQYWEKAGLTCRDAREWIQVGFELDNYDEISQWKKHNNE